MDGLPTQLLSRQAPKAPLLTPTAVASLHPARGSERVPYYTVLCFVPGS